MPTNHEYLSTSAEHTQTAPGSENIKWKLRVLGIVTNGRLMSKVFAVACTNGVAASLKRNTGADITTPNTVLLVTA